MGYLLPLFALFAVSPAQAGSSPVLMDIEQARIQEYKKIQAVRDHLLEQDPFAALTPASLLTDPAVREMGLDSQDGSQQIEQALLYPQDNGVITGYTLLKFDSTDPALNCTIPRFGADGQPKFVTLKEGLQGVPLAVYKAHQVRTTGATPGRPAPQQNTKDVYEPFIDKEDLQNLIKNAAANPNPQQPYKVTSIVEGSAIPVHLYVNSHDQVLAVLDRAPDQPLVFPDRPYFTLVKNTPAEVETAEKKHDATGLHIQNVMWGFMTPDGIVNLEHLRREAGAQLRTLRDKVRADHPTTADFPPEMLQTPEFKATGLDLEDQGDVVSFQEALLYAPEGAKMSGYHPIDFAKDKAADDSAVTRPDGATFEVKSIRDMYAHAKLFYFKIKEEPADPKAPQQSKIQYMGPMTPEAFAALQKSTPQIKVTEFKDQDVPVNLFTNDEGSLAFVMAFLPKDLLLIPTAPAIFVVSDPIATVKPIFDALPKGATEAQEKDAMQKIQKLHRVHVTSAVQVS